MNSIGDISKSAGGKFNLNAMMGVNMMMILGIYRFCISNAAYQSLERQSQYRWEEQVRLNNDPAMQFVGNGNETIKISGTIYPQFKGGLRQITLMRTEAGTGIPMMLISGNGNAFGRWCIIDITETQSIFMKDGTPRKISFSLTLKRYGEEKRPGVLGVVQQIAVSL